MNLHELSPAPGSTQVGKRKGRGNGTGNGKTAVHTVCRRFEAIQLQRFVHETDPHAFMIITTSSEIIGRGFRGV